MNRCMLGLAAVAAGVCGPAAAQTAEGGYVETPRLILIQADRDWATYYNLASHHSDGERYTDAYALRAPVERRDQPSAWLHARFDCKGDTYENLGWFAVDGEGVGARESEPTEPAVMPQDGPFAAYLTPMRAMACYGDAPFSWADNHSVAEAILIAPTHGLRVMAAAQAAAVRPPMAQPTGALHYLALGVYDDGWFVAPDTVKRDDDRMGGEAMVLRVQGHLWRTAEGDIRYSWEHQRFECASGEIVTSQSDHYGEDGALIGTLGPLDMAPDEADVPEEVTLMGYICLDVRPPEFQVVPSLEVAVRGVVDSVAAARGAED